MGIDLGHARLAMYLIGDSTWVRVVRRKGYVGSLKDFVHANFSFVGLGALSKLIF